MALLRFLCFVTVAALTPSAIVDGQSTTPARPSALAAAIGNLPEFAGPPVPLPPKPSPFFQRVLDSKTIDKVDPKQPETIQAALKDLNALITEFPVEPGPYYLRAHVGCLAGSTPDSLLQDLVKAESLYPSKQIFQIVKPADLYAFRAKVQIRLNRLDAALTDLDAAIRADVDSAADVFNDGGVAERTDVHPCDWTLADIEKLRLRYPRDPRPLMYRALYRTRVLTLSLEPNAKPVLDDYDQVLKLDDSSALAHYFLGHLHVFGRIGGLISDASAKCLEFVEPRTKACLELDEIRRAGLVHLTQAIALDSKLRAAYSARAAVLLRMKEYRRALRDYDAGLALNPDKDDSRILYNDRGLAKMELQDYRGAIADFSQALSIGCEGCFTYENRANAYLKIGDNVSALADVNEAIKKSAGNLVQLMHIEKFRLLYSEFDAVADNVLAERLRSLFAPATSYANFAKSFLVDGKFEPTFVLHDLYLKRGDIYLKLGRDRLADADFQRVRRAYPTEPPMRFRTVNGRRQRILD